MSEEEDKEMHDGNTIEVDKMSPDERLNFLLLFLSQNLASCDLQPEFILVVRREGKGWGALGNMPDHETMQAVLGKIASREPTTVETRHIDMKDFTNESRAKKRH